ncbi:MAG: D-Ala-D-Ala carboxypeptidase family metallohydrolase [Cetobacterium sp.]
MKISNFFTKKETTVSSKADSLGIKNECTSKEYSENVVYTAARMDTMRLFLDAPLTVNSWFRSLEVNNAVNGSKTSNHMKGLAVDVTSKKYKPEELAMKIRNSNLSYDQLIIYPTFVHFGFCKEIDKERKQLIRK